MKSAYLGMNIDGKNNEIHIKKELQNIKRDQLA